MKHWYERALMRFAERFRLNPSGWIPHIKPNGIYEMGTRYDDIEQFPDNGEDVPIECFSIYNVFWQICWTRRGERNGLEGHLPNGTEGFWEQLWSFLSDVDLGVYDTTNWVPVNRPERITAGQPDDDEDA